MKQIEEVLIWKNGEQFEASILNAIIVNDNLQSNCTFYYSLNAQGEATEDNPIVIGQMLAEGNLSLSGDEYLAWDGDNDYAYSYIAEKLNLTIVNE